MPSADARSPERLEPGVDWLSERETPSALSVEERVHDAFIFAPRWQEWRTSLAAAHGIDEDEFETECEVVDGPTRFRVYALKSGGTRVRYTINVDEFLGLADDAEGAYSAAHLGFWSRLARVWGHPMPPAAPTLEEAASSPRPPEPYRPVSMKLCQSKKWRRQPGEVGHPCADPEGFYSGQPSPYRQFGATDEDYAHDPAWQDWLATHVGEHEPDVSLLVTDLADELKLVGAEYPGDSAALWIPPELMFEVDSPRELVRELYRTVWVEIAGLFGWQEPPPVPPRHERYDAARPRRARLSS